MTQFAKHCFDSRKDIREESDHSSEVQCGGELLRDELVSIVVPVFNGMPHLRPLTDSILAQTHTKLDIVFVDGGSTDESLLFLGTLKDSRVRVITMPSGTTAGQNWTAATQAANAEYIKLICQDDVLHPNSIHQQLMDLQQHPNAAMTVAQRDVIDSRGKVVYAARGCAGLNSGLASGAEVLRAAYLHGTNILGEPLAVLFRRAPLLRAMPWEDSDPFVLDLACYSKVAHSGDVFVRKAAVGAFRVSGGSWSTNLVAEQRAQFRRWQQTYVEQLANPPSLHDRTRAAIGLNLQALLRRVTYRWLTMRKALD